MQTAALIGSFGVLAVVALHSGLSLSTFRQVGDPAPEWLLLALATEAVSIVAYAVMVRELLQEWSISVRMRTLLRATLGGIAMAAALPGGQALSVAYWYKQLRREGVGRAVCGVVLTGATIVGVLSLSYILLGGVVLAGNAGPLAAARIPLLSAAGALLAIRFAFRRRLGRGLAAFVGRLHAGLPEEKGLRPKLVGVVIAAYVNWLLDCACLVASLRALDATIPAKSILLTYALAQIVAAIPLLPGGGGTVELSLSVGFTTFGHTSGHVFAGILLYRLISCWGLVPIGWLAVALGGRTLVPHISPVQRPSRA